MKYRSEIDGLRALAVIPVLLFHTGIPFLTGGYLGVDVFFVISGFLITKIIIDEIHSKQFSILNFYERRARRILPALFVVFLTTALFLPLFSTSPNTLTNFGESAISVSLFASNIYFFLTSGYFGSTSELSPLLHTWSLAVEEQFYVFFPILAILIYPFGRKFFIYSLILITIVSLAISEWGWRNSSVGNFYLIPSRAFELLFGSFGAIFINSTFFTFVSKNNKQILSFTGLILIVSSYFLFTSQTKHPSLLTLIPVLGSLLIILFASSDNLCGKILQQSSLVHIGLISYSLYLWHQPILSLAKLKAGIHLDPAIQLSLLFLIYILSYLTWRYIENPFRNKKKFNQKNIFNYSIISLVLIFIIGIFFYSNVKWQKVIYPKDMQRYSVLLEAHDNHKEQGMYKDECKIWNNTLDHNFKKKFESCKKKYGKAIFIIGGSHGMDLYNTIASSTANKFVASISRGFCRAHDFIGNIKNPPKCQYQEILNFFKANKGSVSSILYTQTPDRLFIKPMESSSKEDLSIVHVMQVTDYLAELEKDLDANIIMIGMLPPMKNPPIKLNHKRDIEPQLAKNISKNIITLTMHVDNIFKEQLANSNITYISKFTGFKLNMPDDLMHQGKITYSDHRHLSKVGEELFGQRLVNHLIELDFNDFKEKN